MFQVYHPCCKKAEGWKPWKDEVPGIQRFALCAFWIAALDGPVLLHEVSHVLSTFYRCSRTGWPSQAVDWRWMKRFFLFEWCFDEGWLLTTFLYNFGPWRSFYWLLTLDWQAGLFLARVWLVSSISCILVGWMFSLGFTRPKVLDMGAASGICLWSGAFALARVQHLQYQVEMDFNTRPGLLTCNTVAPQAPKGCFQ